MKTCTDLCHEGACINIVKNNCSDMFFIPTTPVLFGHFYLAFKKNSSQSSLTKYVGSLYMCYNNSYYDPFFNTNSMILFNNTKCVLYEKISDFLLHHGWHTYYITRLRKLQKRLKKYQSTI